MLKSRLYDYSDAYILASGTITVPNKETQAAPYNRKNVMIKSFAPFPKCIIEINNTQIDNAKYIDVVMPTQNIAMIIQELQEVYGNNIDMNQL